MGNKSRKTIITILVLVAGLVLVSTMGITAEVAQKPRVPAICIQCHTPDPKILRGVLGAVAGKAKTIQVNIGAAVWVAKWDDGTQLVGAESFGRIPAAREIALHVTEKAGELYASKVSVKQPMELPAEKLIKTERLARLVEKGPVRGNFVLVDSRPVPRYHEGHIPGAIGIFDGDFDKHVDKLPKEKDKLLIFYCGGVT